MLRSRSGTTFQIKWSINISTKYNPAVNKYMQYRLFQSILTTLFLIFLTVLEFVIFLSEKLFLPDFTLATFPFYLISI